MQISTHRMRKSQFMLTDSANRLRNFSLDAEKTTEKKHIFICYSLREKKERNWGIETRPFHLDILFKHQRSRQRIARATGCTIPSWYWIHRKKQTTQKWFQSNIERNSCFHMRVILYPQLILQQIRKFRGSVLRSGNTRQEPLSVNDYGTG